MEPMNPDGLSEQAHARLAAKRQGAGADLALPDLDSFEAVARWRAAQHRAWGEGGAPGEADHEPLRIGDVDCLAAGPVEGPYLLHLHSGGFCLGSPGTDRPITARLATSMRVISVAYRLAPEHPFPCALDDAETVYRALASQAPVAVSGISAGGNLAVALALRTMDAPPLGLALLCPHLDFRSQNGSASTRAMERAYLGSTAPDQPLVSPLAAELDVLARLPPILLQTTSAEYLHDQAARFVATLVEAGVSVRAQNWDGLWHAWHYHRELPEAWSAVDRAGEWLLELHN